METQLADFIHKQNNYENNLLKFDRNINGVFLTNDSDILDNVLNGVVYDNSILFKTFLEPSCGQGILLLKLILKVYALYPDETIISNFIANNLFFSDINNDMIEGTKKNISCLYFNLFGISYLNIFKHI